jgi:hypothetical protein
MVAVVDVGLDTMAEIAGAPNVAKVESVDVPVSVVDVLVEATSKW